MVTSGLTSRVLRSICAGAALALTVSAAAASPPELVHYQGVLRDGGDPVAGPVDLGFAIFDSPAGGVALWTEDHTGVPLSDGVFSVFLGSMTPLNAGVFTGEARWIEIVADGNALPPRRRLTTTAYAFRASITDSVITAPGTDWSIAEPDVYRLAGSVGIGTSTPTASLHIVRDGAASVRIDADPANSDESAQPSVTLTQDGGAIGADIGFFDGVNDFTIRRFSPGPDTTSITFLDTGNNVDINADVFVGGGVTDADVSDGTSEAITLRGRSAPWMVGVQNETAVEDSDFFIGKSLAEDGTFHIERGGDIGIGTTNPSAKLEVVGHVNANEFQADTNLGSASAPVNGGLYRDNVVYAWARVSANGTLIESFGFVEENVKEASFGQYSLTMTTPVAAGGAAVVTVQNSGEFAFAQAGLTIGAEPVVTVITRLGSGDRINAADLSFCLIVLARP